MNQNLADKDSTSTNKTLSHVRADGSSHMVDVSAKASTDRSATAVAHFKTSPEVIDKILKGDLPKGEVLSVARVAGIMAAKRTSELIPLCHPLAITKVEVDFARIDPKTLLIRASVKTTGKTGVEMEALTAVNVAALTVYDMVKAVDKLASITDIKVVAKSGGKSGDWIRA